MIDAVVVKAYLDLGRAEIAVATLKNAGINAWLRDEQTTGIMWGIQPALGGIRLMTSEEDAETATKVLESLAGEGPDVEQDPVPELEGETSGPYWVEKRRSRTFRGMVALFLASPILLILGLILRLGGKSEDSSSA